jgi:hypothetical protein
MPSLSLFVKNIYHSEGLQHCVRSACLFSRRNWTIDQTSFRNKGNVVVFGVTKLLTKECTISLTLIGCLEGEMIEKGWGNQLIMSNTCTVLHSFGRKRNEGIYICTVLIVASFSLNGQCTTFSQFYRNVVPLSL